MTNEELIQQKALELFPFKEDKRASNGELYQTDMEKEDRELYTKAALFGLSLQTNEWVSATTETMPEDPAIKAIGIPKYLILDSYGSIYEAHYDGVIFYTYDIFGNIEVLDATHWMPLPNPPNK